MAFDPQRPPLDWKSAMWLPVWLIGMGIISWQGQYSGRATSTPLPPTNTGNIPFWWDIAGRRRVQRGHLLLGDGHQAAARGDAPLVNKQAGEGPEPMPDIHH